MERVAVAAPPLPPALTVPSVWPAVWSVNVTVPVGDMAPVLTTVAVNTTVWLKLLGFGADASVVVELALLTVCVRGAELLPLKLPSPP
jgi:hypothetical protein